MKPSVARRCKDQVREDGGRGGRDGRDVPVWRVCTFRFFYFERMVEKREMEPSRTVGVYWGKKRSLSIKKRKM